MFDQGDDTDFSRLLAHFDVGQVSASQPAEARAEPLVSTQEVHTNAPRFDHLFTKFGGAEGLSEDAKAEETSRVAPVEQSTGVQRTSSNGFSSLLSKFE
jgi:hypothetical protein